MINVKKFNRSATVTSATDQESNSRRSYSEPTSQNNKVPRSASYDLGSGRKVSLTSLSGAVFGADIIEVDKDDECEPEEPSKIKKWWTKLTKIVSSQIGLLLILLGYSFIGAAIFQALEQPHEDEVKANITNMRNRLLELFNRSNNMNSSYKLFKEKLLEYEEELEHSFHFGIKAGDDELIWDYWGALFFSATVYTTIG